nr:uncharacterized protein LOC113791489 [Dermatophagoides pteronyssinus]
MLKLTGYISETQYQYPTNDNEFSTYCKNVKSGSKSTKEYSQQCLQQNPSGKSILMIMSYSFIQSIKKYCSRRVPKIRNELIEIAKCVNPNRKHLAKCWQIYLNRMNLIFNVEPNNNKFPYLCCITDLFSTCMAEKLRNYGNPICTEKIINQFQQFYGSTMGNVMNFACENFEDQQDRCEKMIEKQQEKLTTGSIKPVNWRTPFPILIEFFQTL